MIPRSEWEWFGYPAHFSDSEKCLFHMCTKVGCVVVSTVGDYRPHDSPCTSAEIGSGRTYETMVFAAGERCGCGCGTPRVIFECDHDAYQSAGDARQGHMAMCEKWANSQ